MGSHHLKESTMIHPRDITTEAEAAVLEHADRLAAVIGKHWHPTNGTAQDDVMLLVADLLRAHAETGIEMQTWRAALDVVMDHLAAEPEGADLLHRLGRPAWFTVIGTPRMVGENRSPFCQAGITWRWPSVPGPPRFRHRPQRTLSERPQVWTGLGPETFTLRSDRSTTRSRSSFHPPSCLRRRR